MEVKICRNLGWGYPNNWYKISSFDVHYMEFLAWGLPDMLLSLLLKLILRIAVTIKALHLLRLLISEHQPLCRKNTIYVKHKSIASTSLYKRVIRHHISYVIYPHEILIINSFIEMQMRSLHKIHLKPITSLLMPLWSRLWWYFKPSKPWKPGFKIPLFSGSVPIALAVWYIRPRPHGLDGGISLDFYLYFVDETN